MIMNQKSQMLLIKLKERIYNLFNIIEIVKFIILGNLL